MAYNRPTQWDWIKLIPKVIYWRFFWQPPTHVRVRRNAVPSSDVFSVDE
jgi:hypothetical protein